MDHFSADLMTLFRKMLVRVLWTLGGDFDTVYIEMVFWRICLNHWKFQLEIVDVSWCFALTPALQGALKTCTCGHWEGPKGGTREQFFLVLCTDLWQVYCFQRLIYIYMHTYMFIYTYTNSCNTIYSIYTHRQTSLYPPNPRSVNLVNLGGFLQIQGWRVKKAVVRLLGWRNGWVWCGLCAWCTSSEIGTFPANHADIWYLIWTG